MNERSASPLFVGREAELTRLHAALSDALAGRGRIVLIEGDVGMGKTRLCQQFAASASDAGVLLAWGRCYEGEGQPAFWPWTQVMDRVLASHQRAASAEHVERVRQLVPQLDGKTYASAGPSSAEARFLLFRAVARVLASAAEATPLVVLFDDLHGADHASLLLLEFIARELGSTRLLLVGTKRPVANHDGAGFDEAIAGVLRQPHAEQLTLRGFAPADTARYIEGVTRAIPDHALVESLQRQTEGNPLFVSEFVRVIANEDQSQRASTDAAMPNTVKAVIARRMRPLSDPCRHLLKVAAVLGREFAYDVLEALYSASREAGTPALADLVSEAITNAVLLDGGGRLNHLRFAHVLYRDVLYAELSGAERVRWHRLAGSTLARLTASSEAMTQAVHHFVRAGAVGDLEQAARAAHRAGDRALEMLAFEEAAQLYELALNALERLPSDTEWQSRLLLGLGSAKRGAGQNEAAGATFWKAADAARQAHAPEMLARAAIAYRPAGVGHSAVDERHVMLLEEALDQLPASDSPLRAMLMGTLACALYAGDATDRREQLSRAAVAMAQRTGDREALAHALSSREMALWSPDHMDLRAAAADEHLELALRLRNPELARQAHVWRVISFLEKGDVAAADREIAAHRRVGEDLPQARWQDALWKPMRALLDGDLQLVEAQAEEALALGSPIEPDAAMGTYAAQIQALRWDQGRLMELVPMFEMLGRQDPRHELQCALAFMYAEAGSLEEARLAFETVARTGFTSIRRDLNFLAVTSLLAVACAALQDRERAQQLYDALQPFAGRNTVLSIGVVGYGDVSRYLGLLAAVLQRTDDAVAHFEAALATHQRMRARGFTARTQADLATALLARAAAGDRERAAVLLDQAVAGASELEMGGLLPRIAALQEQLASATASTETFHLRRQGQVWSLRLGEREWLLRDAKGVRCLARLLAEPGREFHVLDLVQEEAPGRAVADAASGLPILDSAARESYRRRVLELREQLAEAEEHHDAGAAQRARYEIDAITEQLAGAVGLGGRERTAAGAAERARSAVTQRIKDAIRRIAQHDPSLGEHLSEAVRTGTFCSYAPPPNARIRWIAD